jgi:pimeloyl-ACP methyl ester carboxylesterase
VEAPAQKPRRSWLSRLVVGSVGIILFLPMCGLIYQGAATALDKRRHAPPGRLVDIGGRRLHLYCAGTGSPVVVAEAGNLSFSMQWAWVQPTVASFTRVCSYDRAGYGWSDPAPWPPTAGRQAEDLFNLLTVAGERSAFVLVGHSYGAYVVRAFARSHADSVTGVVLVDPAHPSQHDTNRCDPGCLPAPLLADLARIHRVMPLLARFGVLRALRSGPLDLFSVVKGLPAELRPSILAALSTTRHWTTGAAEFHHYDESAADARALPSLGSKPLAVVVADSTWVEQKDGYKLPRGVDGRALDQVVLALNRDQAGLSTDSNLLVVRGATHVSLVTHREYASQVSDAIYDIVQKVRSRPASMR